MATEKHLSEASHGDPKGAVADSLQPSRNLKGGGGGEADEADPKRPNRLRTPT